MTDNDKNTHASSQRQTAPAEGIDEREDRVPKRVIGTPPPAKTRYLLGREPDGEPEGAAVADELPGEVHLPSEGQVRKAERLVALFFGLSLLGSIGFVASYVAFGVHSMEKALRSNLALGTSMTLAFLGIAVGATIWVRKIMPHYEVVQERGPLPSRPEDKQAFAAYFMRGAEESQLPRRRLLRRALLAALVPVGLAPVVLLRDLGPLPRNRLRHTVWRAGLRLVADGTEQPIRAADFSSPGAILSVVPEGHSHDLNALAKAALILIKMRPDQLKPPTRLDWTVDGIVAYSKICTHVGCPAALYERTTQHILCPCHQSTFDATRGAKVIFGPAARPLPQLPITVDAEGYLVAQSDFHQPVGPSFWERG